MRKRKAMFVAVCVLLVMALLAACGGEKEGTQSSGGGGSASAGATASSAAAGANGPDISKKVELVWYTVGDPHPDQEEIMEQFNKMLEKDLNATLKLNFTTWNEWETKYKLLLTSGEKIDMIFTATWADYYKLAKQGAFHDLTEMLPVYAPKTWESLPKADWEYTKVGGKIFAVPNTYPEYTPDGFVYREDWRKELGLPEFKDLDSVEAYLDAVKTKKNVTPVNGKSSDFAWSLFKAVHDYQYYSASVDHIIGAVSYDKPRDVQILPMLPEYEAWVKKMKTWAMKGYWPKNTLSSQQEGKDFLESGQGAVYWRNATAAQGVINEFRQKGITHEIGYFPFTRFHQYAIPTNPAQNGMGVPKAAQNPERSLMVLDKLRNDPAYYRLLTYGIEGKHYALGSKEGTRVVPAPGVDPNEVPRYDIASWGFRNEPAMGLKEEGGWEGMDALLAEFNSMAKPDIISRINLDFEPVKAELAAVSQVHEQYGKPLLSGLVKDVDEALQNYRDKLKAAGIEKVHQYISAEVGKQMDELGVK